MVDTSRVRVVLYLETDTEAIRGSVWTAGSGRRDFYGWLELANALEVARGHTGAPLGARHKPSDRQAGRP